MNEPRKMTLNDWFALACDHLPRGWGIEILLHPSGASLCLTDEHGCTPDVPMDGMDTEGAFLAHINFARKAAGLEPLKGGDSA